MGLYKYGWSTFVVAITSSSFGAMTKWTLGWNNLKISILENTYTNPVALNDVCDVAGQRDVGIPRADLPAIRQIPSLDCRTTKNHHHHHNNKTYQNLISHGDRWFSFSFGDRGHVCAVIFIASTTHSYMHICPKWDRIFWDSQIYFNSTHLFIIYIYIIYQK